MDEKPNPYESPRQEVRVYEHRNPPNVFTKSNQQPWWRGDVAKLLLFVVAIVGTYFAFCIAKMLCSPDYWP